MITASRFPLSRCSICLNPDCGGGEMEVLALAYDNPSCPLSPFSLFPPHKWGDNRETVWITGYGYRLLWFSWFCKWEKRQSSTTRDSVSRETVVACDTSGRDRLVVTTMARENLIVIEPVCTHHLPWQMALSLSCSSDWIFRDGYHEQDQVLEASTGLVEWMKPSCWDVTVMLVECDGT